MAKIEFLIDTEAGNPPFLIEAEGFPDVDEKTGTTAMFLHYINVKYRGRDVTRLLRKHPAMKMLWETVMERAMEKLQLRYNLDSNLTKHY